MMFIDPNACDFIALDGGKQYVRKFEIVGVRWEQFFVEDESAGWRLRAFFSDCPNGVFYADDATTIMTALGLPSEPPQ